MPNAASLPDQETIGSEDRQTRELRQLVRRLARYVSVAGTKENLVVAIGQLESLVACRTDLAAVFRASNLRPACLHLKESCAADCTPHGQHRGRPPPIITGHRTDDEWECNDDEDAMTVAVTPRTPSPPPTPRAAAASVALVELAAQSSTLQ